MVGEELYFQVTAMKDWLLLSCSWVWFFVCIITKKQTENASNVKCKCKHTLK